MIVDEPWDLNIIIVTWGGAMIGADQDNPQEQLQPQVRPVAQKKEPLTDQKQKEIF